MNYAESVESETDYVAERLIVYSADTAKAMAKFQNLWIVSFAYFKAKIDILPLGQYACLGFVDISYSSINLKQLQETFRRTQIIRLHAINAPSFKDLEYYRGFIINTVPNVWMLDGLFIPQCERTHWREFFNHNQIVINAKWKIKDSFQFIPTNTKPSLPVNDVDKLWTEPARYWLSDRPLEFTMAYNDDVWKLSKFSSSFEAFISEQKDALKQFLAHEMMGIPKYDKKISLLLIMVGSLFEEFPVLVLQQTLKALYTVETPHWKEFETSPISWSLKDRLCLLGILIGRLSIDIHSPTSRLNSNFSLSYSDLKFVKDLIYSFIKNCYPASGPKDPFDFDEWDVENTNLQLKTSSIETVRIKLYILQVLMVCPNDALFLQHIDKLYKSYCDNIALIGLDVEKLDLFVNYGNDMSESLTMSSKALELKLCMYTSIANALKHLENSIEDPELFDIAIDSTTC